ncbi:hypothetical protein B0H14DRAFT_3163779 [Mycena olivaceomarginata]|nr:hypothetical protein B0H14DRAFT_3163779 [Mycena olivaceomarginata]
MGGMARRRRSTVWASLFISAVPNLNHSLLIPLPSREPAPEEEDASSKTTNTTLRPASTMVDIATAEGKRASQIVYASGFVNRLITPALADPRAWKPFKMEVRGQKLILHKSLSDRAAGVRDLFAVGVVEELEKEEETDTLAIEDAGAGRGRAEGMDREGDMEALVYVVVIATVFLRADAMEEEAARCEEEWRDYALAVLFSLPLLAGRAHVETEFVRPYLTVVGAPSSDPVLSFSTGNKPIGTIS